MPAIEESKIEGDVVKKKKSIKFKIKSGEQRKSPRLIEAKKNPNDYTKDETKVAAEEDERNSTEEEAEPVVISVVDHNEDEENLDSNNEDKADEDDFIEDGKSKKTTKPKKKKRKASSPVNKFIIQHSISCFTSYIRNTLSYMCTHLEPVYLLICVIQILNIFL